MNLKITTLAISVLLAAQLGTVGIATAQKYRANIAGPAAFKIFSPSDPRSTAGDVTCDQSGPTGCDLDSYDYLCTGGGGGMSSEPGGGVTCSVRNY